MYTGNILDPIHGLIKLSEIEKWVLSQKPFNRLRRVKQNTFLRWNKSVGGCVIFCRSSFGYKSPKTWIRYALVTI